MAAAISQEMVASAVSADLQDRGGLGIGAAGEHRRRDDVERGLGHVAVDRVRRRRRSLVRQRATWSSAAVVMIGTRPARSAGRNSGAAVRRCQRQLAPSEVRMPSPSVWCEHPLLERRLGELGIRLQQHLLDQGGIGDPGDDVVAVVVDDDRLLVDRPRQARERIAHERQQEAAQRQRPWRRLHRRRIEGLRAPCVGRARWSLGAPAGRTLTPPESGRSTRSRSRQPPRASLVKILLPPLDGERAWREQHERPQEGRAPIGELEPAATASP